MVSTESFFHMFCFLECCSKYWIPNNITGSLSMIIICRMIDFCFFEELGLRLKTQVIGQPLVHDIILNSISSHVSNTKPSKALVLSLHGSTGTGM